MWLVDSNEDVEKIINDNEMVLIYFGSETCGVCSAVKPKIKEILKDYPKIKSVQVDVEKSIEVAAKYNVFTLPVVLVYIEEKETIREARHISIQDVHDKLDRYYNMLFE